MGIDPGLSATGYGVITQNGSSCEMVAFGSISTKPTESLAVRLCSIYEGLSEVIGKHQPSVCAIEEAFYGSNAKTALQMGHARGVSLLVAARAGVKCAEYSARKIKQSIVGNGAASKQQVQYMVQRLLGLPDVPRPNHAADALAAALCYAQQLRRGDG